MRTYPWEFFFDTNRFMRELGNLKKTADYSSCDTSSLNSFLVSISPEMSQYTYPLLQSGVVDVDVLGRLTEGQLSRECCIDNSIHRLRILDAVKGMVDILSLSRFKELRRSRITKEVLSVRSHGDQ